MTLGEGKGGGMAGAAFAVVGTRFLDDNFASPAFLRETIGGVMMCCWGNIQRLCVGVAGDVLFFVMYHVLNPGIVRWWPTPGESSLGSPCI